MNRILNLFDIYFLIMMLIQGLLVGLIDFYKNKIIGNNKLANKCRLVGIVMILIAITLYDLRMIFK